jgi:hypothetical protein
MPTFARRGRSGRRRGGGTWPLARRLPADARIVSIARDGALTARIATVDPDALRDALRRDAALKGLRDAGQVRGGEALIVTLKDDAR